MAEQRTGHYDNPYKFNEGGALKKDQNGLFSERASLSHRQLDEETGNYYYGARYYTCIERSRNAPRISLWLSVDPLAEKTMDPYGYCYNNPINLIDPTGMCPEDETCSCHEIELDEVVATTGGSPKDRWVKGAGLLNNLFKHSNRIYAEQYNDANFGSAGDINRVSKGRFELNVTTQTTDAYHNPDSPPGMYHADFVDISLGFSSNTFNPNKGSVSSRTQIVQQGHTLLYSGFGFDPGLGDLLGFWLDRQIQEGNITGRTAIIAGVGLIVVCKGKGPIKLTNNMYRAPAGGLEYLGKTYKGGQFLPKSYVPPTYTSRGIPFPDPVRLPEVGSGILRPTINRDIRTGGAIIGGAAAIKYGYDKITQ